MTEFNEAKRNKGKGKVEKFYGKTKAGLDAELNKSDEISKMSDGVRQLELESQIAPSETVFEESPEDYAQRTAPPPPAPTPMPVENAQNLLAQTQHARNATNLLSNVGQIGSEYMSSMGGLKSDPTFFQNLRQQAQAKVGEAEKDLARQDRLKALLGKAEKEKEKVDSFPKRTQYVYEPKPGVQYRAVEKEGRFYFQNPKTGNFDEIEDTSQVKEYGKDIGGERKNLVKLRQAMGQINDYKRWVKNEESQLVAANNIINELQSPGKLSLSMVRVRMPKLFGEVGNLSAFEQQAWSGSPEFVEKIKRFFVSGFSTEESLTEKDKSELMKVVQKAAGETQKRINKKRQDSLSLFREMVPEVYVENPEMYEGLFKGTIDLKTPLPTEETSTPSQDPVDTLPLLDKRKKKADTLKTPGKIRVRVKSNGKTGTLSEKFFDPLKHERL